MRNSLLAVALLAVACGNPQADSALEKDSSQEVDRLIDPSSEDRAEDILATRCGSANPLTATGATTEGVKSVSLNGHMIEVFLRAGWIGSTQYAWALIVPLDPSLLVKGDRVWMDISDNNGTTHTGPCGTGIARGGETRVYSLATATSTDSNVKFRACGGVPYGSGVIPGCTNWW